MPGVCYSQLVSILNSQYARRNNLVSLSARLAENREVVCRLVCQYAVLCDQKVVSLNPSSAK